MSCSNSSDGNNSPAQQTPPVGALSDGYTELPTSYDNTALHEAGLFADSVMYFKADKVLTGTIQKVTNYDQSGAVTEITNSLKIILFQTNIIPNVHTKNCELSFYPQADSTTSLAFVSGDQLVIKNTYQSSWQYGEESVVSVGIIFAPYGNFSSVSMLCTDHFYRKGQAPQAMTVGEIRNGMKNVISFASKN